ncbi:EAL domain-containing protein [uncultured Hoeflea sp.]|uniref:putative bifunctional diguanylate cyclase/phosphodiesterase n=1 Tax=uncultured Hoeflea sp. TaxID=538666 RepID=UPI0030EC90F4|tara:strand:- start:65474 stop:66856 length:1383 start_codon:yes stop_codon:yes gene_type:complete
MPTTLQATPGNKPSQRLRFAYKGASLSLLIFSLGWFVYFASIQNWPLACADLCIIVLGGIGWLLVRRNQVDVALMVSEVAFLTFTIAFCLVFDVPSEAHPRVSHLFLPAIALMAYFNYLRTRSPFQLVVIAGSLLSFIFFSSTKFAPSFALSIPDDIRHVGIWINSTLATAMLCGGVYAIHRESSGQSQLSRALRTAVRNEELELHFQPQVDHAQKIVGAEALLRWTHPRRGNISPGEFIPVAEECGLMPLIGGWVLKEACRTLATWKHDPALSELTLAVNVSANQFNLEGFEQSVLETVALYGVDPGKLKLELTETVIISGVEPVVAKMNTLRAAGIEFALDDFGTGYSSLSYLRQLPVSQLKIDRSFVKESLESPSGASLIRSIVRMGLELELSVLAEGIETVPQHLFLLDCGCHEFQGYHFGRPVPEHVFRTEVATRMRTIQHSSRPAPEPRSVATG